MRYSKDAKGRNHNSTPWHRFGEHFGVSVSQLNAGPHGETGQGARGGEGFFEIIDLGEGESSWVTMDVQTGS